MMEKEIITRTPEQIAHDEMKALVRRTLMGTLDLMGTINKYKSRNPDADHAMLDDILGSYQPAISKLKDCQKRLTTQPHKGGSVYI